MIFLVVDNQGAKAAATLCELCKEFAVQVVDDVKEKGPDCKEVRRVLL